MTKANDQLRPRIIAGDALDRTRPIGVDRCRLTAHDVADGPVEVAVECREIRRPSVYFLVVEVVEFLAVGHSNRGMTSQQRVER